MAVPRLLACLGLLAVPRLVVAQIYTFAGEPVPPNRTLHTLYAFYVFSYEEAPERNAQPFVKFSQLVAEPTKSEVTEMVKQYEGLQLSILRYRDFWSLIDPQKFCSTDADVSMGLAPSKDKLVIKKKGSESYRDMGVYTHTVRTADAKEKDAKDIIDKTGVYILVVSNCGSITDATISGTVIVKNAYGFLPGNEYHKLPFYGWLCVTYIVLAVIWLGLSARWWKELFMIQNCIAAVIFFGLLESFLWFTFYGDWNKTGVMTKFLFAASILFTVVKATFSYMLVLVASLGWGVTRPYLDTKVIWKIQALSFSYIVLDFIREAVLTFRHSHSLSLAFVMLCLLPVSLLNGITFAWVFTALSKLMEALKERKQHAKLALFQKLWRILVFVMVLATSSLLFQVYSLSRSIVSRWQSQWLLTDGISHALFIFVLICMMYLWAPNKNSHGYAYSTQIGDHDDEKNEQPGAIWADDDDLDDEGDGQDGDSFWDSTKASNKEGKNVSVIGASNNGSDEV